MEDRNERQKTKVIEQEDLLGKWTGDIETYNQKFPITLIFQTDGDIHVYTKAQFNTGKLSNEHILNENIQLLIICYFSFYNLTNFDCTRDNLMLLFSGKLE